MYRDLSALCVISVCSIREVIAFPKNQAARDVMADAPSPVEPVQLKELHIQVDLPPAKPAEKPI